MMLQTAHPCIPPSRAAWFAPFSGQMTGRVRAGMVTLALLTLVPLTAVAQPAAARSDSPAGAPAAKYQGIGKCELCHNQNTATKSAFTTIIRDFCTLNEIEVFTGDKHHKAFELLTGETGLRMERVLARSRGNENYKVTTDKLCLACHANWHWKEGFDQPPLAQFGVTCESCHGPSSLWEAPHDDPEWRTLSPAEKESKWGFVDVRNPVRRAQQCYSCHIGSVREGRVVTHEMYAAGHPPLPGIELESFSSQMPAHWRSIREKGEFRNRARYLELNFPGQNPLTDLSQTRSVLVGGVMALRESLHLFASQAVDNNGQDWPELAVFDCAACHHELRAPAWRQTRGYGSSIPGRPQMFAWPTALVKLAIEHRAGGQPDALRKDLEEFQKRMESVRRALDRRPFGDPQAIEAAVHGADGLVPWLDQLAADVVASRVQEPDARRAISVALTLNADDYPDYNSARQILWAIRTIQSELSTTPVQFQPMPPDESDKAAIDRALENLKRYNDWQAGPRAAAEKKIDSLLTQLKLEDTLRLKLPAGADITVAGQLPEALKAASSYDPDWFRGQLKELSRELEAPQP